MAFHETNLWRGVSFHGSSRPLRRFGECMNQSLLVGGLEPCSILVNHKYMVNIWKYMVNIWIFMTFHCKFHHPNWLRFFKGVDWNHQPILDRTAVMVTCWGDWRIWKKTSGADSEENTKVTGWRTADFNIPPSPKFQSSGLSARIFWVGIEPICWTSVAPGAWKCRWRKRRSSPGGRQILS